MARQSKLVSPSLVSEMKAELQSLAETEPGAKDLTEVVAELMPLVRGCRDRGHSWKRIAESLSKFHPELTLSRLKRIAFQLDPSLKGNAPSKGSFIPDVDEEGYEESNWSPSTSIGEDGAVDRDKSAGAIRTTEPKLKVGAKKKAIDFEDEL